MEPRDEGQKIIAHYLALELSRRHEITRLDLRNVFSRRFWYQVKNSDLQIIHYVPGPTIKSLFLCKLVAAHSNAKKIVISAPQPVFSTLSEKLIPFLKPDLILVQSKRWAKKFKSYGCITSFVPNGVDTNRFAPISAERRQELRKRYEIDENCFLVLHAGHITRRRNIQALVRIQGNGRQVLMAASKFANAEKELEQLLIKSGCLVLEGYVPYIEHIYAMSDCYAFPVKPGNTVLTPLSVLEAMACNLPVVSARFEGLLELFEEGDGLFFADSDADMVCIIDRLEKNRTKVRTREKVLSCSWCRVAEQVEQHYHQILAKE